MGPEEVVDLIRSACGRSPPAMSQCVTAVNALVDYGVLLDEEDEGGLGVDLLRFHELVRHLPETEQVMVKEFIEGTQLLNEPGQLIFPMGSVH